MRRKILSTILALCMVMSMLPMTAFAIDETAVYAGLSANKDDLIDDIQKATGMDATAAVGDEDAANLLWFAMNNLTANAKYTLSMKNAKGQEVLNSNSIAYGEKDTSFTPTTAKHLIYVSLDEFKADTSGQGSLTALGEGGKFTVTVTKEGDTNPAASTNIELAKASDGKWTQVIKEVTEVTITGLAQVGQTLTANVTPANANVVYQWKAGDADIDNATTGTYKLTTAEKGKAITVVVTGAGDWSGTATSTATAAVTDAAPAITVVPANLTAAPGQQPPMYGHATTYDASYDPTTGVITVTATGLEKTTNTNNSTAYWVGIGMPKTDNAEYAWDFGDVPGSFVANDPQPGPGRVQTVGNKEYTTLYWSADTWAENADKTGYVSVKAGDEAAVTYPVKFNVEINTHTIAISDKITNGTVTVSPTGKVATGEQVTVTATPETGYTLGTLTVTDSDGKSVTVADGKFTMPAKDVTITATFTAVEYTINLPSVQSGNSISSDKTKATYGQTVTLTPTLANGYGLKSLTVTANKGEDGETAVTCTEVTNTAGKITAYTFSMPAAPVTVEATYVPIVDAGNVETEVAAPAVSNSVSSGDGQTVATNAATALTNNKNKIDFSDTVMNAAADKAAANVLIEETVLDAAMNGINAADTSTSTELKAIKAAVADADTNNKALSEVVDVVTQVYMDVAITAATPAENAAGQSVTFDITPKSQTILVPANLAEGTEIVVLNGAGSNKGTANAIPVVAAHPIDISTRTQVSLPLPAGFTGANLWVKHVKDGNHYYLGTLAEGVLTFTTTNGFSPFTVYADAAKSPVKTQIGVNGYESLADAIAAVKDNETIKLLDNVNLATNITVDRPVTFTIDKNGFTIAGQEKIVAADGYKNNGTGDRYAFVVDRETPPPSGGGGVSSNVTIDRTTNGKVTVTPTAPSKGATVTINLTPDTGYAVGTVTVTDKDGKAVELTKVSDTKYTFTMPDGKVKVAATFTKVDTPPATGFTDVAADAYYADAVKWAVDKGITNGITATTFGPNNSCTRGQMVTFLWRAAGSPAATGTNSFTDVDSSAYYYNAVLWAVEKGITNGTTSTTFSPNATVNRGQTVTFLYRYAESPAATGDSSFTDVAADAYYADAVKWAVAEEITNGTSATTFAPSSNCTRGQIVTFLYRQMAE